jgi:hypothetical protein
LGTTWTMLTSNSRLALAGIGPPCGGVAP